MPLEGRPRTKISGGSGWGRTGLRSRIPTGLREQVGSGQLKPGGTLPSFAALCDQYKVSNAPPCSS
nr:GntR family transcriptional regulator [Micromonospora zingiberis]